MLGWLMAGETRLMQCLVVGFAIHEVSESLALIVAQKARLD
jgi:hypothetical protein